MAELQQTSGSHSAQSPSVMKLGFYNSHSELQHTALELASNNLKGAVEAAHSQLPVNSTFNILDCGCSQGKNSITAVSSALSILHDKVLENASASGHKTTLQVQVSHEDLPSNDFNSLMQLLADPARTYIPQNQLAASSSDHGAPLGQSPLHVFSSCIGRSFYERLVPNASQHLIMAYTCLHWLRRKPLKPVGTLFGSNSTDANVRAAFSAEFEDGFLRFLTLRAQEAAPGGQLIFHFPIHTPANNNVSGHGMAATAAAMVAEGLIDAEDLGEMCSADFLAPHNVVESMLASPEIAALWCIQRYSIQTAIHPAWTAFNSGACSKEELAAAALGLYKAVYEPTFLSGLKARGVRSEAQAQALVEELFVRCERDAVSRPLPLVQDYVYVWLERKTAD